MITEETDFLEDVLQGLSQPHKSLPSKYFYDRDGSYYFECICGCEEYYLTRVELAIMADAMDEIAQMSGGHRLIVEYGSGSAVKTGFLLEHLNRPVAYIPIDIFPQGLEHTAKAFAQRFPDLEILPVCADFNRPFEIPRPRTSFKNKLIYFPGSTIGNFIPSQAVELLRQMFSSCRPGDLALVGVDLKKPQHILHKAYNDDQGYTAAFNLNLLKRINRELDADFCVENFYHKAFYNEGDGRVEMHLISSCEQAVSIHGQDFYFKKGEGIHTESSYKYDVQEFGRMVQLSGFSTKRIWTDQKQFFAVVLVEARNEGGPHER
jgi:dimethylhistidine N-methyltransferase